MNRIRKPEDFAPENMVNKSGKTLAQVRKEKARNCHLDRSLKITEESGDVVDIFLSPDKTPETYNRKLQELIQAGMSETEAKIHLLRPIQVELFYDFDRGLFAVESEAVDGCEIYNPHTGEKIPLELDES